MMNSNHHKTETKMSPPPFSGTILQQVLQFLLPKDVAHVSMVCKAWHDDLKPPSAAAAAATTTGEEVVVQPGGVGLNSYAVWKQAVTNSNPDIIQAVIQAVTCSSSSSSSISTSEKEAAAAAQIDFHAIAKGGFGRQCKKPDLAEPTFRIEDLLIVLELKLERVVKDEYGADKTSVETLGTFSVKGSKEMLTKNKCGNVEFDLNAGPTVKVEAENPLCPETYNGDTLAFEEAKTKFRDCLEDKVERFPFRALWSYMDLPFESAGTKMLLYNLKASVTLFRCDGWRSFRLLEDITIYDYGFEDNPELYEYSAYCNSWGQSGQSPFARNETGIVARDLLKFHEITAMTASMGMGFKCVLPPPGSMEEPEPSWLKKFRMTRAAHTMWSEQDDEEISQVKSFQFRLVSISLSLGKYVDDEGGILCHYEDPKGFLLLLEGLDWQ